MFESFEINVIPRNKNIDVDLLANVSSRLLPPKGFIIDNFYVELFFRPSIPDNVTSWRVFDDDKQLLQFLHSEDTFKDQVIDDEEHDKALQESTSKSKPWNLWNTNPKKKLYLERYFDMHNKFNKTTNYKTNSSTMQYKIINLGTTQNPKNVNLGTCCSPSEIVALIKLLREFKDVFAWTYTDLKTYDTRIIQHVIPLKQDAKPFQQKLSNMHSSLEPRVKQDLDKLLVAHIIFPVRHCKWVANLVFVREKNRDIRFCIDFHNLNRASEKDNCHVPPMEPIL